MSSANYSKDQSNITERVLFPGLDGLSRWLTRYYMRAGDVRAPEGQQRGDPVDGSGDRAGNKRREKRARKPGGETEK